MILILIYPACAIAFDDGDFQYWSKASVAWKITDDWKTKFSTDFRFGDKASDFYYQNLIFSVKYYGIVDWFNIGLHYQQVFEDLGSGWKQENRPFFTFEFVAPISKIVLKNRSRFEYRNRQDNTNMFRYRNKTTFGVPIKIAKFQFRPYIADELFYDSDQNAISRNRLYGGINFRICKHISFDIHYLWQRDKEDVVGRVFQNWHILGTGLELVF